MFYRRENNNDAYTDKAARQTTVREHVKNISETDGIESFLKFAKTADECVDVFLAYGVSEY